MKPIHITVIDAPRNALSRTERVEGISFLAFTKHATFAGLGPIFDPNLLIRRLVQTLDFLQYWDGSNGCFTLPPILKNDPTERNYVSNRIGRALADYCAKRISRARFTHCYESAMRMSGRSIRGCRPDFYCDTLSKQFSVEAKGFSRASVSDEAMEKHKNQAQSGPLSVHFSKACVSYDLYRAPKVKYYDPPNASMYDGNLNSHLSEEYYETILSSLKLFPHQEPITVAEHKFFAFSIHPFFPNECILVHEQIIHGAWKYSREWLKEIPSRGLETKTAYIDSDGIGIGYVRDQPKAVHFSGSK